MPTIPHLREAGRLLTEQNITRTGSTLISDRGRVARHIVTMFLRMACSLVQVRVRPSALGGRRPAPFLDSAEIKFIQSELERLSGIYQPISLNPRCITRRTTTHMAIRPQRRPEVNCQRVLSETLLL